MKILLAEDHPRLRDSLMKLLMHFGHHVTAVADGALLLGELEGQSDFDVIVTDDIMPYIGGLEVLRRIRADARFHELPVILYSANETEELVSEALRLDATFVAKLHRGAVDLLVQAIGRHGGA